MPKGQFFSLAIAAGSSFHCSRLRGTVKRFAEDAASPAAMGFTQNRGRSVRPHLHTAQLQLAFQR